MKNHDKSILTQIYVDLNSIEWSSNTVKLKALNFITNLFDNYVYKHKSFDEYKHMSREYWFTVLPGSDRHINEIKRQLTSNQILEEVSGLYDKDKRVKSYKFNSKYILNNNNNSDYIIIATSFCKSLDTQDFQDIIINTTNNIITDIKVDTTSFSVESIVDKYIDTTSFSVESIKDDFVDVMLDGKKYRYNKENAIKFANSLGKELVAYKKKCYIVDSVEEFKTYKRNELKVLYTKQLFDIENNILHISRNETNNRLDTNLTNLKSDLWNYLTLENEELVEIDIVNAQFAIAANIILSDDIFKSNAINGTLYDYIATELNITRKEAKSLMFQVAFDKVKSGDQDLIRNMFPIFMNSVDTYKKENGYKAFSNLLQKTEANIMIDNVLYTLLNEGFKVVSVHDSIRCKKSDYNKVLKVIKEIFTQINFKATLKEKNTNTLEVKENTPEETKTTSKEVYLDDFVYQHTITDIYALTQNKLKYITKTDINNFRDFKYLTIKELLQALKEMNHKRKPITEIKVVKLEDEIKREDLINTEANLFCNGDLSKSKNNLGLEL